MIIFDEKDYAERLLRFGCYQTLQHQGSERRALAKYLKYDKGYNDADIIEAVSSIKSKRKKYYDDDIWDIVMSKLLNNCISTEYISGFRVGISQSELDVILDQPTIELRNLLFVLTVYYKWARNVSSRCCMRHDDIWVKEADIDCCELAGLGKMLKADRMKLFNILYHKGVYQTDYIRRYHDIFTLPFIDDKKPVIVIDDFNDIIANLEFYLDQNTCTHCTECGTLIYKTSNRRHLCKWCSNNRKHEKRLIEK